METMPPLRLAAPVPLLAGLLLVAGPEPATAQEHAASLPDAVSRLELGSPVRTRIDDGTIVTGRLTGITRDREIRLEPRGREGPGEVALPIHAVDSLWAGRRSGGRGAVGGAAIGAALGAVLTKVVGDIVCDAPGNDCDTGPSAEAWIGLIGGGAVLGAGIGWAVGHDHVRWEPIWPAGSDDG